MSSSAQSALANDVRELLASDHSHNLQIHFPVGMQAKTPLAGVLTQETSDWANVVCLTPTDFLARDICAVFLRSMKKDQVVRADTHEIVTATQKFLFHPNTIPVNLGAGSYIVVFYDTDVALVQFTCTTQKCKIIQLHADQGLARHGVKRESENVSVTHIREVIYRPISEQKRDE